MEFRVEAGPEVTESSRENSGSFRNLSRTWLRRIAAAKVVGYALADPTICEQPRHSPCLTKKQLIGPRR